TASLATQEEEIGKQLQDRWQQLGILSAQKDTRKEEAAPTSQKNAAQTKSGSPQPQPQETTPKLQPTKEKTQTRSTTRRVCPASDTIPSEQHPVVFTDEKTTA